ncbi:prevent-host-death family protein [Rhizobium sp. NFR03]|nr:prevent-host-death family protein [Rhizobium sp. NFR03]
MVICTEPLYDFCIRAIMRFTSMPEPQTMPQTSYKISEARKNFAEVLERANQGEEIIIMRGNDVYARIGPADLGGKRPFGLLRQRGLPDNLFDEQDDEQAAIDAGDWNDDAGIWQGKPADRKIES